MSEPGFEIRPVDDAAAAIVLGRAAGLEDAEGDTEGLLARWGANEGGRLVGTVALRYWHDMFIVGWMAVVEDRRGAGVGAALLQTLERDAVARRADRLWVTARAPGFYFRAGFTPIAEGPQHRLLLDPCLDCEQYGVSCHPVAAVKRLADSDARPHAGGRPETAADHGPVAAPADDPLAPPEQGPAAPPDHGSVADGVTPDETPLTGAGT